MASVASLIVASASSHPHDRALSRVDARVHRVVLVMVMAGAGGSAVICHR
jgi:hypothetical protein